MVDYPVEVTFELIDGRYYVTAYPYPVPGGGGFLENGDTVTWTAVGPAVDLQIGFEFAYDLKNPSDKRPTGPMGPFESLSHPPGENNVIVGRLSRIGDAVADWRYLCIFFRNGVRTPWKPGAPGADDSGVDTHRPPPFGPGIEEGPAAES